MTQKKMLTVNPSSTYHFAKKESGGKGFNLYLLQSNKINVPPFITLPPIFFQQFKIQTGIKDYIENILMDQHLSLLEISEKIHVKIMGTEIPDEIMREFSTSTSSQYAPVHTMKIVHSFHLLAS